MRDAKKMIHIRVNDKLHESLILRAKDTNRTMSQYIRDILSTHNHPLFPAHIPPTYTPETGLPVTINEAQEDMEKRDQFGRRIETVKQQEEYGI